MIDPDARQDVLAAAQRLKMARSAHAYVRGNTADFYDWLRHLKRGHLPEGPPVWICGDCHVGNLGPLAHSDGRVETESDRILEVRRAEIGFRRGAKLARLSGAALPETGENRGLGEAPAETPHRETGSRWAQIGIEV